MPNLLHIARIGSSRYRATQAAVSDILPLSVREFKSTLAGLRSPPGVKLKTIECIMALNGMSDKWSQAN